MAVFQSCGERVSAAFKLAEPRVLGDAVKRPRQVFARAYLRDVDPSRELETERLSRGVARFGGDGAAPEIERQSSERGGADGC